MGQACEKISRCGAAAKASSYARDDTVASVPSTPMRLLCVALTAARTAGAMTSTTGTSYRSRASLSTAADAVLQAITSIFTSCSTSSSRIARERRLTSAIGLGPYGVCLVSLT